jgi:hypothetical protein
VGYAIAVRRNAFEGSDLLQAPEKLSRPEEVHQPWLSWMSFRLVIALQQDSSLPSKRGRFRERATPTNQSNADCRRMRDALNRASGSATTTANIRLSTTPTCADFGGVCCGPYTHDVSYAGTSEL